MKRIAVIVSGIIVCLAVGSAVQAGLKNSYPISVGPNAAFGSLGDARASADNRQYIGCAVENNNGSAYIAACSAQDSAGNFHSCTTTDTAMATVAMSLSEGGYLLLQYSGNTCTTVEVFHDSYMRPMTP